MCCEFPPNVHLLLWEIVWRNAPLIWRDFGSALPFQTRLTQTKPVVPLSNEHGSQVKDQSRWQCCHNKHKISLSAYTWCKFTFRTRLVIVTWIQPIISRNFSDRVDTYFRPKTHKVSKRVIVSSSNGRPETNSFVQTLRVFSLSQQVTPEIPITSIKTGHQQNLSFY